MQIPSILEALSTETEVISRYVNLVIKPNVYLAINTTLYHLKNQTMKVKSVFVIIALCAAILVNAQDSKEAKYTPEEKAKMTVAKIGEKTKLTAKEKDGLTGIYTEFFTGIIKAREAKDKEMHKTLVTTREAKVKQLFNNDTKYAAYQKAIEEMKQEKKEDHGERHGGEKAQ